MWNCGGVSVNYHRLSDFRAAHGELLERILTDSIAVLLHRTFSTVNLQICVAVNAGSFK